MPEKSWWLVAFTIRGFLLLLKFKTPVHILGWAFPAQPTQARSSFRETSETCLQGRSRSHQLAISINRARVFGHCISSQLGSSLSLSAPCSPECKQHQPQLPPSQPSASPQDHGSQKPRTQTCKKLKASKQTKRQLSPLELALPGISRKQNVWLAHPCKVIFWSLPGARDLCEGSLIYSSYLENQNTV